MPCYDPRDDDPRYNGIDDAYKRGKEDARHNSPVAELLCAVMKQAGPIRRGDFCEDIPGLSKWWFEHIARDAKRKKK